MGHMDFYPDGGESLKQTVFSQTVQEGNMNPIIPDISNFLYANAILRPKHAGLKKVRQHTGVTDYYML